MAENSNTEQVERSSSNIQSEIMLVGSLYNKPDLYVSYGAYMRSKYDFSDEATRFFYDAFELMYTTFSQSMDENKVNTFMTQDEERLKQYKRYKGYRTLTQWMELADETDFKNYYNTVKKYSLIREYERNGYPIQRILNHPKFDKWLPKDIYRIIRSKADRINTEINASDDSVELTNNTMRVIDGFLEKPDMGIALPWKLVNEMFRGCRLGKVYLNGFLSNEGKSRNMMLIAAYITLVLGEKFLVLSNEMDEEDLRSCLITTVINNPCFQQYHGVRIKKCEKEIVLGIYHDDKGNIITRYMDNDGNFTESMEDYKERLMNTSADYRDVIKVAEWIDRKKNGRLFFKDMGMDYSDEAIEFEVRRHKVLYDVKYCAYDTLKGYRTDDWQVIKQTATKLKELMKELKMFCWTVYQLTDETISVDIFHFSSMNIANCKGMKHIADALLMGKKIAKEEYHKYAYISEDDVWGDKPLPLHDDFTYFAIKIDKNRGGSKDVIPLFKINLDYNTWEEVGFIVKNPNSGKKKKDEE